MIDLHFTADSYKDSPEYPAVSLLVTIDDEGMSWQELMKVFARELPRFGYILNTEGLEEAIDDYSDKSWMRLQEALMGDLEDDVTKHRAKAKHPQGAAGFAEWQRQVNL